MVKSLFHGSKSGIEGEIAPLSREDCDFGRGFYLGDSPSQPLTLVCHYPHPVFYRCELDLDGLRTYEFASRYAWALYIAYCRKKLDQCVGSPLYDRIAGLVKGVDVVVGKIANDRMFMVLNDFFDGAITDKAMLSSLEVLNLGRQYCTKTPLACSRVHIADQRVITSGECLALQVKAENQRNRAIQLTNAIYKQYRRDGLFFDEFIEKYADGDFPCS